MDSDVKKPTEYGLTVVAALEEAFHNDYDITSACRYAKCTRQSYYNWLRDIPGFAEKMEDAQNKLNLKASEVMAQAIAKGDVQTARWYKERRDPRYKQKVENELTGLETRQKIKEFLDDDRTDDVGEQPSATPGVATGDEVAQAAQDIPD